MRLVARRRLSRPLPICSKSYLGNGTCRHGFPKQAYVRSNRWKGWDSGQMVASNMLLPQKTTPHVFIVLLLTAAAALAQPKDWLIVPGKRLGPITPDTTRANLERLFGKANIEDRDVDTGEGPEPATVVLPNMPDASLAILWRQELQGNLFHEDRNRVSEILICYARLVGRCKWHTENRVSLGTSLEQLEALNGHAFQIEPWGYDLGGNISSWKGGGLGSTFQDGGKSWSGTESGLWLTVNWQQSPNGYTPQQRKALDEIRRQNRKPLSSDQAMKQLHLRVERMRLVFPGNKQGAGRK